MNPQMTMVREAHRSGLVRMWSLIVALGLALAGCGPGLIPASPEPTTESALVHTTTPTMMKAEPSPTASATPTPIPPTATSPPTPGPTPLPSLSATESPAPTIGAPSFAEDIQPIFTERCIKCHSGESPPRGLHLDSYEHTLAGSSQRPVVIPGNPEESQLVKRVKGIAIPRMPFDGPPFLSDEEIVIIEAWVAAGAPNN